jgi:predicted PurR-regulated permease PerM
VSTTIAIVALVLAIIALMSAAFLMIQARAILRSVESLQQSMQGETLQLVKEATALLVGTKADVARVEDLMERTEERSMAIDSASKLAISVVASPIVRARALRLGIRRGLELFRSKRR